jgi:CheY-like chemotaxis protein
LGLTKEKPIRLYTEVDASLPKAFGDEFRTRQILFNLVSNAAKFTDEGSITTSTRVIQEDGYSYIQVAVTDTGMGIRKEDFGKLFESFQQVDNSTTRAAEGTGLGLPLARSLAELQGGRIWVESEYGVGSTFSVAVPIQPVPVRAPQPESTGPSNGSHGLERKTVVVVEDSMDMTNFYRRHLSRVGYDVIGATRLEDVTYALSVARPAAVIINTDIEGGWDILENVRQLEIASSIPMIVNGLDEDSTRSQQLGAAAYLVRPFNPEELIAALQKVESGVSS